MAKEKRKRVPWRSVCVYAFFYAFIIMVGVGATFHWRALDLAFAFAILALILLASAVVLWRAWRHRDEPASPHLGQLAAMPRSWRKWILGESDDRRKK